MAVVLSPHRTGTAAGVREGGKQGVEVVARVGVGWTEGGGQGLVEYEPTFIAPLFRGDGKSLINSPDQDGAHGSLRRRARVELALGLSAGKAF